MEKKKLLLVAVSVGVVLLIIIGIPLLIITPRSHSTPTSLASPPQPIAYAPGINQGLNSATLTPIPEFHNDQPIFNEVVDPPLYVDYLPPNETSLPRASSRPTAEVSSVTTITIVPPETAAVPNTPPPRASSQTRQPAAPVKLTPVAATAAKPAPAKETAPKPAPAAAPKASSTNAGTNVAAKPAAKPSAETAKTNNNYWVQTGAFSTQVRAEGAKESLASKGITSIIDNRDIDGKTWYRVRVGPYTSETEANYWLALVKSIDGFAESQIRQTPIAR